MVTVQDASVSHERLSLKYCALFYFRGTHDLLQNQKTKRKVGIKWEQVPVGVKCQWYFRASCLLQLFTRDLVEV